MNLHFKKILYISILIFSLPVLSGEKDLYEFLWLDPDKSVFVLQNKVHPKNKTLYLDIGYLSNTTSNFQDTNGVQVKAGYFFTEDFGIEANFLQYSNTNNTAYESIKVSTSLVPFIRRPLSSNSLFLVWSPFYGKINTFNKIYYFDWGFGVGTGVYTMESNRDTAGLSNVKDVFKTETFTPLQLKTNVKFHINKRLHVGIEFLNTNYQADTPKNKGAKNWTQNNDLIFTLGVSF